MYPMNVIKLGELFLNSSIFFLTTKYYEWMLIYMYLCQNIFKQLLFMARTTLNILSVYSQRVCERNSSEKKQPIYLLLFHTSDAKMSTARFSIRICIWNGSNVCMHARIIPVRTNLFVYIHICVRRSVFKIFFWQSWRFNEKKNPR